MIQDNQKNFTRLQMLIDAVVIAVCYVDEGYDTDEEGGDWNY